MYPVGFGFLPSSVSRCRASSLFLSLSFSVFIYLSVSLLIAHRIRRHVSCPPSNGDMGKKKPIESLLEDRIFLGQTRFFFARKKVETGKKVGVGACRQDDESRGFIYFTDISDIYWRSCHFEAIKAQRLIRDRFICSIVIRRCCLRLDIYLF